MKINSQIVTLFLCLVANAVFVQAQEASCNCEEINQAHQNCINDWSVLDGIRKTLEQQVRDTEFQVNERCSAEKEQVKGELHSEIEKVRVEKEAQIAEARKEEHAKLEMVRSESQANLNAAINESQSKLEEVQRQAQAELSQCQSQHQELNAQFEDQSNTHRRLQESSQELEQSLSNLKSEKSKLEKTLSDKDLSLSKEKKSKNEIEKELKDVKKLLDEMIAARTIITIDYDLLNERIEEIKAKVHEKTKDFMAVVHEHLEVGKEKAMEFYKYLETEIYPQVKQTIENDVIPFVKTSWKQANDMWEEVYSPYRPTVNKQIKVAKKETMNFYKQNLEPSVKEYKLDVHAATAKKTVEEKMALAHEYIEDGCLTGTGVALNFLKLEEGPEFAINAAEKLHANYQKVAFYIECFLAFLVIRFVLKTLFKKKKIPKSVKKQQWKEKEAAKQQAAGGKGKQQPNNKKAVNGKKNSKKNK